MPETQSVRQDFFAICMKCKKAGYFAKVCKTQEENTRRPKKGKCSKLEEETFPTVDMKLVGVQLEGVLVDSGSTCRVIDTVTWEMLKEKKVKCISRMSNWKLRL